MKNPRALELKYHLNPDCEAAYKTCLRRFSTRTHQLERRRATISSAILVIYAQVVYLVIYSSYLNYLFKVVEYLATSKKNMKYSIIVIVLKTYLSEGLQKLHVHDTLIYFLRVLLSFVVLSA